MGRVPESANEDRLELGFHGKPEMPREDGTSNQGHRLPACFCHSVGKRCNCQGHDSLHDVAATTRQKNALLQQAIR